MADTNGTPAANELDAALKNKPEHITLPPPGLTSGIEKVAEAVARRGLQFEEQIRNSSAKANFLAPDDPYHEYYRWRLGEVKAGRGTSGAGQQSTEVSFKGREVRKGPEKPEEFAFSARMPNISAQDLEIVKLTALFAAKNGKSWMTTLSQREAGNYQFDFLRPQHSMYQYFTRLVDQYTDLLNGDSVDEGRPQKKRMTELEANAKNRFRILERSRKRAEYVKYEEEQKEAKEDAKRKEDVAFAQIDWHDFVVVETVVFTEEDQSVELPPPQRLNDLQSASLETKAAMSIAPGRRLEEAVPDIDSFYAQSQQAPAPPVQPPPTQPQAYTPTPPQPQQPYQPSPNDEDNRMSTLQADRARARAAQEAAKSAPNAANIKIRSNYVPAAQARNKQAQATSICAVCSKAIPNDEYAEHMRIEMLDPQWREQAKINQQRSSTTNLSTADVARNLKRLASQRTDVFDPVTGRELSVEEAERRKRAAGNPAEPAPAQAQVGVQGGEGQRPMDVQEQIRQIHERARQG